MLSRSFTQLYPQNGLGWIKNLSLVLIALGRHKEAISTLHRAIALNPNDADVYVNLGGMLQRLGQIADAIDAFRNAIRINPEFPLASSGLLFCMGHDLWTDPKQLFAEHLAFGERFEAPLRAGWQEHSNAKDPERCLQLGFVSGDLYNHAVANFLTPVLERLAQNSSLSLHAYYVGTVQDQVTQGLRSLSPHWHQVTALSPADLADAIRADGIDILFDLSGHTSHNRLLTFARKPAPMLPAA